MYWRIKKKGSNYKYQHHWKYQMHIAFFLYSPQILSHAHINRAISIIRIRTSIVIKMGFTKLAILANVRISNLYLIQNVTEYVFFSLEIFKLGIVYKSGEYCVWWVSIVLGKQNVVESIFCLDNVLRKNHINGEVGFVMQISNCKIIYILRDSTNRLDFLAFWADGVNNDALNSLSQKSMMWKCPRAKMNIYPSIDSESVSMTI